jgi:hypothetical protein
VNALEVRTSVIHGRGLYACTPIAAGQRVIAYTGERIPAAEALRREADPSRPMITTVWLDEAWVIDGAVGGSDAIYINHSCAPNCEFDFDDSGAWVVAGRDIAAGEELTLDYAYDASGPPESCACGAATCRGTINASE